MKNNNKLNFSCIVNGGLIMGLGLAMAIIRFNDYINSTDMDFDYKKYLIPTLIIAVGAKAASVGIKEINKKLNDKSR